jgi:GUN4-like
MKWIGMILGVTVLSGIARLRNLIERGRRDRLRSRSYRPDRDLDRPSDVVVSTAVQSGSDIQRSVAAQIPIVQVGTKDEYTRLRELLAHRQYGEADRETWRLMLRISGAHQRGYFEIQDFEEFPASVLQTLDQLWLDASGGRLGLSVQKRIYREEDRQYDRLGSRLGWVVAGKWLTFGDPTYHQEMPEGHLPLAMWRSQLASFGFFGLGMCLEVFLSREDL